MISALEMGDITMMEEPDAPLLSPTRAKSFPELVSEDLEKSSVEDLNMGFGEDAAMHTPFRRTNCSFPVSSWDVPGLDSPGVWSGAAGVLVVGGNLVPTSPLEHRPERTLSHENVWGALYTLTRESKHSELYNFMSYIISANSADEDENTTPVQSFSPTSPRRSMSPPMRSVSPTRTVRKSRKLMSSLSSSLNPLTPLTPLTPVGPRESSCSFQTGKNMKVKTFLNLELKNMHNDPLWRNHFESMVQGTFFRACTRPLCLKDHQLSKSRLEYTIDKAARYAFLILFYALHLCGNLAGEALGTFLPLAACVVASLALPCSLLAVQNHVEILHFWLATLVAVRWIMVPAFHYLEGGGCFYWQPFLTVEAGPVVTTLTATALIEWRRSASAKRAAQRVAADKAAYDRVWSGVLRDPEEVQALERVRKLCQLHHGHDVAVQCVVAAATRNADRDQARASRPVMVKSIDQLVQQSMLLLPLLRLRVQWWAMQSQGWFKVKKARDNWARSWDSASEAGLWDAPFVKWEDVHNADDAIDCIDWASSKPFARSVEKISTLYNHDVSRLCDVTRESIWFESVRDIETCLMQIKWDRWAEVVGVKNALDPSVCADNSGGFRFVKLLLRLAAPEAKEIGLEGHVCEVLLVLKKMELCKSAGWHARYRQWRQARPSDIMQRINPQRWGLLAWVFGRGLRSLPQRRAPRQRRTCKEEEVLRIASQNQAAEEMSRRRLHHRAHSREGMERKALLEECMAAMKNYLWGMNSELYGKVGERWEHMEAATTTATFASCFRMKQPVLSLLCRPGAQLGMFAAGVLIILLLAADLSSFFVDSARFGRAFKFTNLEARSGSLSPPVCVGAVSILHGGKRPADRDVAGVRFEGTSSLVVEYVEPQPFDGWSFTRHPDPGDADCEPVRFKLESWDPDAQAWGVVGSSSWVKEVGRDFVFEHGYFAPRHAPAPGSEARFKLHDEPYAVLLPLGWMLVGVAMALAAGCGFLHKPKLGECCIRWVLALAMGTHLCAAALLALDNRIKEAVVVLSLVAGGAGGLLVVRWWPTMVLEALVGYGCVSLGLRSVVRHTVYGPVASAWEALDPVAALLVAMGIWSKALVLINNFACERAYLNDVKVYEHVWEQIAAEDASIRTLDRLMDCTNQMPASSDSDVTQRCLPWHSSMDDDEDSLDPFWWRECALACSHQLHHLCPKTESIDQLYAQAEVAAVVMRHKLKQWAVASHGLFLRKHSEADSSRPKWVKATELLAAEADDICWGTLKSEGRALEKSFRCYGGDVSRLLDLSRHSIAFETPAHILQCLQLLRKDPDVTVVRVKNDLHRSKLSSSGYRHVLVNIMVVSEETQRMGVSMHVSELQLIPLGFALAKTDEGHRRYVRMRNARGE